ncbi:MAG: heparinase II/III family protein [Methyloceanibacter sp.]
MVADLLAGEGRSRAYAPRGPGPLRRFMLARMARLSYPGSQAEQLLLAPQELRTADPSFATEVYNGHFGLAGRLAELGPRSPFEIEPPSEAWARELYGFGWLRHLRAAGSELAREQAKVLVGDFVRLNRGVSGLAFEPEVVARRAISWLSNSVVVLDSSEPRAYQAFLRALTEQLRYLSACYRDAPDGVPRLVTLMALIYAGLCIADQQAIVDAYVKPFCKELDRQMLSDGGHISRDPSASVELLLDLLPLRQCFVARDRLPPKQLSDAIDRAMPMLRFFRLGDGALARFNGCGPTPTDALATVLAYDDVEGAPLRAASNSGYARIAQGQTLLIADLAAAPAASVSTNAHAGCLSFEMSAGPQAIIVNCGAPPPDHDDWRLFARSTAAHSTLVFEDTSSAQLLNGDNGAARADGPLVGPPKAQGTLREEGEGIEVKGSHDGYVARFGVRHERRVVVATSGLLLAGEDRLVSAGSRALPTGGDYAIRFHLHPDVTAQTSADGRSVALVLPNRETWTLSSNAPSVMVEDSVFLADARGPRQSSQVVLAGALALDVRVVWTLEAGAKLGAPSPIEPDDAA